MTTSVDTASRVVHNIPTKILPSLSIAEQYYILEGCRDNCRLDGRSRKSLRPFTLITSDPLVLSHGSSRIIAQKTEIVCSVKAELVHPRVEAPDKGVLEIHVDIGSDAGDYRKRRLTEHQLQASLNFLLSDNLIPLQSLCVVEGHYVWKLHCDIIVLTLEGGSIIDVASRALRGALMQTKIPHILPLSNKGQAQMDLAIDGDIQKAQNAVGEDSEDLCPVIVSVAVCKCPPKSSPVLVLDTTLEEELCASCIVRVAVAPSGDIVAIQSMNGSLPIGLLTDIKSAAIQASKQVFQALDHTVTTSNLESLLQPAFQIQ
mmetsp:Transcript_33012/g.49876  ORF Transcript_33012/g.49876 Transcript_33012/m.49876 type:complete len:316 (-) Transcript_33012:166-1113(-)